MDFANFKIRKLKTNLKQLDFWLSSGTKAGHKMRRLVVMGSNPALGKRFVVFRLCLLVHSYASNKGTWHSKAGLLAPSVVTD